MYSPSLSYMIDESTKIGEVRRAAIQLANSLHLNEVKAGEAGIIATEIAGNILKHAKQGTVLLRPSYMTGSSYGVEIMGIDKGPGIGNLAQAFRDGYSTAGTPGTGLGALRRLSTVFDIYSKPQWGTLVVSLIGDSPGEQTAQSDLEFGVINVAMPGEDECGDTWAQARTKNSTLIMIADGLGHGPLARVASRAARECFLEQKDSDPLSILKCMHEALKPTRGAAVAVALLDHQERKIHYAGIGNISAGVYQDFDETSMTSRQFVSMNGTLGHEARKFQEFVYDWPKDSVLIMFSDGLQNRWRMDQSITGLFGKHPSLIAGALYKDYNRGRDDTTIVVVK